MLDKISFWSLYFVIVLLPIFFLPLTKIPVETSKNLLLVIGLSVSIISWSIARLVDGKLVVPTSRVLVSGLGVVLVFLVSALISGTRAMSLFGIMLDVGTFWSVFSGYVLMLFCSFVFKDKQHGKTLLLGFLASLAVLFVFQIAHIFAPEMLDFGVLAGKTANLVGTWNSLGLLAVLGVVICLFLVEFKTVSKKERFVLAGFLILALFIMLAVNFPLAWKLLGGFALFIFVFKISFNNQKFPIFSFGVLLVSLLFFISGQFIGSYVPSLLHITNLEVSPTLSSTMHVANETLKRSPFFGVGPNNFEQAWSQYKSPLINTSAYWDTSFFSGSGLIPTFIVTTGMLGLIALFVFLYTLVRSGGRKLFASMKSLENAEITIAFTSALFLAVTFLFYAAGTTLFLLFFIFTGVYIGLSSAHKENGHFTFRFLEDPRKSFFSIFLLVVIIVLSVGLTFEYLKRFASAQHFGNALTAETPQQSFAEINKATDLYPNDLYFRTRSQVELMMINKYVEKSKTEGLTGEESKALEDIYERAVGSAVLATEFNSKNSLNWELLGNVYHSVANLGLANVYGKAIEAYKVAASLDPLNPRINLLIASALIGEGDLDKAKEYISLALRLKPNYPDAVNMLSQIEASE